MKSKTNLGGAILIAGKTLMGVGVLTQLAQFAPNTNVPPALLSIMWYVALLGFIVSAIGEGFTAYFSADSHDVETLKGQLASVPSAIESGNTEQLRKSVSNNAVTQNNPQPSEAPKTP